jgi:hypothetical protein
MKKKLDTSSITNELEGSSFFKDREKLSTGRAVEAQESKTEPTNTPLPSKSASKTRGERKKKDINEKTHKASSHDTTTPRYHDTMIPRHHEAEELSILEEVRKAVKQIGKESATQRLTLEEKQQLRDIEYAYQRQGVITSGNEIIRIAINYVVREYKYNGENSILAKVLKELNS